MSAKALTPAQANLELMLLSSEAETLSSSDFYAWLRDLGLPAEAAIRLKAVAEITAEIGQRIIHVGKMIIIRIMAFVRAHANLAIGIAIGAAIGALVNAIPWIGPLLSPIVTLIGVTFFALAGHRMDKAAAGVSMNSGLIAVGQDLIEIAKAFFKLLVDIFNMTLNAQALRGL